MGMLSIEGVDKMSGVPGAILGSLGQTQTVTAQEVTNALLARGYTRATVAPVSPPISPVVSTTQPTMTRAEAIKRALDSSLASYGYSPRCSRLGGCSISESRFGIIVSRATSLATAYLRAGAIRTRYPTISPLSPSTTPTYSVLPITPNPFSPSTTPRYTVTYATTPAYSPPSWAGSPGLSPKLGGISGTLHSLGQNPGEISILPPPLPGVPPGAPQPDMTTWDWVAIISQAAQGVASTVQAYANARAQRERAGQTATLTAGQLKIIVNEAIMRNPTLNRTALVSAAAGAAGDVLPKGMPGWVVPVVVGSAVVAVMSMSKGRGR